MIDKWNQSLPVLALLRALQSDAHSAGGRVVVLMGNHEAEFLAAGGRNKKAAEFVKELTAKGIQAEDVAKGKDALGVGGFLRGTCRSPLGSTTGSSRTPATRTADRWRS